METNLVETLTKAIKTRDTILKKLEEKRDIALSYYDAKIDDMEEKCDPAIAQALYQRKSVESFYEKAIPYTREYFYNKIANLKDRILLDKTTCSKYSIAELKKILVGEDGELFLSPAHQVLAGEQDKKPMLEYVYEGRYPLTFQVDFSTKPDEEGYSETYFVKISADMKTKLLDGSLLRDHLTLVESAQNSLAFFMFDAKTPSIFCLNPDEYMLLDEDDFEDEEDDEDFDEAEYDDENNDENDFYM